MSAPAKAVRLEGLDALRAIAALAVVIFHAAQQPGGRGYLAVDFFFMLSGYVMARTYETRLGTVEAGWNFLRARVLRLYPTLFVGSLFALPWLYSRAGFHGWVVALPNLLLIPTPRGDGQLYILNVPAWSILLELVLNALHAALLWRLGQRVLIWAIAALVPMLVWWTSIYGLDVVAKGPWLLPVLTRALVPYCLGIVLYRKWRDEPPVRVPAPLVWGLMPVWFIAAPYLFALTWWSDLVFVLIACPLLIAGGLVHARGSRLAAFAGAVSFPLYAVHAGVVLQLRPLGLPVWAQVVCAVAAGIALMQAMTLLQRRRPARPVPAAAIAA